MGEINFTRASMPESESLIFEINIGREELISVARLNNSWKVLMNSSNPNRTEAIQISWQEFLEIVYEIQKFVAVENEILISHENTADE